MTDAYHTACRQGITIVLNDKHQWLMVDAAMPDDRNIVTTEAWKIERYEEFAFEVQGNSR